MVGIVFRHPNFSLYYVIFIIYKPKKSSENRIKHVILIFKLNKTIVFCVVLKIKYTCVRMFLVEQVLCNALISSNKNNLISSYFVDYLKLV